MMQLTAPATELVMCVDVVAVADQQMAALG
jgi:hypothetical protein